jgi:LacI family transcriptional regulator, repressor for deo operon, udp, cdd, tsx, nupC, and nupG
MKINNERSNRRRGGALHIAEVAALAGVSIATVSRALANPDRVNAKTRDHVLEVVRRTGYTPNVAGRSLRAARSMMILLVVPTIITPFFSELHLGVDQAVAAHGYGLLVGNLQGGEANERRLVERVFAGQADGVLLLNGKMLRGSRRSLTDADVPMVAISMPHGAADVPAVLVQEREGAAAVARHLLELGHRRFGYVTGPADHYIADERWAGFIGTLTEAGIAADSVVRYPGDFHVATGVAAGHRFLEAKQRPTAVFAISDMMAIGFMRVMHAAGLRIPDDVSVAGFDGIEFADYCEPPLTTIRQPREAMGRAATELLVRLLAGETIPPDERTLRLEVTFRPAASTAAPRN